MGTMPIDEITRRADAGDNRAQLVLGWELLRVKNSPADQQTGLIYLDKAVASGSLEALFYLAFWKETKGDVDCVKLFMTAASMGYSPAMHELGNIFWTGMLVKRSRYRAGVYWRMAAKNGHALARLRMRALPLRAPFSNKIWKPCLFYYALYVFATNIIALPNRALKKDCLSYFGRL